MSRYFFDPCFDKVYRKCVKGNKQIEKRVEKTLILFQENPSHPSLRLEKLEGLSGDVWSIRINRKYRIFFYWDSDEKGKIAILFNIGPHDLYKQL
jgi:plasmid maintenance system killer protein